jgi:hypothetical protein
MKTLSPFLLSVIFLLTSIFSKAQSTTFLYYDKNGKGVDKENKASFYRVVTLDDHNNIDTVFDYRIDGQRLAKGKASIVDKVDNHKSAWLGKVTIYNKKGEPGEINNYDEFGLKDGMQISLDADGHKNAEFEHIHGNPSKDFYLHFDKNGDTTKYSYLTHLPIDIATTDKVIVPFTQRKLIYQDGLPIEFYFIDGLSVAVKISAKQEYGRYYEAFVTIENGTGDSFDFNPTDITASLSIYGKVKEAEVFSYDDYMKKVNRQQNWSNAFTAFAESAAATSAGYSSSSTSSYVISSSGSTAIVNSTTKSYDAAAQYAANQNAANKMNQIRNQQYEIKQNISQGYLKLNTILPNSRLIGFVNITYEKADRIYINIPVKGKVYHFEFD